MNFLSNPIVARLLWIFPLLLYVVAGFLFVASSSIRLTLENGEAVQAEVVEIHTTERSEYTDARVTVRFASPESVEPRVETLTLPLTLVKHLDDAERVTVRLLPGADHEVVIEEIARPQWRMALIQSFFALFGAVGLSVMIFLWNRMLRRTGDPAAARVAV
jgi:hypothetical protein